MNNKEKTTFRNDRAPRRRNPFSDKGSLRAGHIASDALLLVLGALFQATAYGIFNAPAGIVPGGIYGISIAINRLTQGVFTAFPMGLPIGAVSLCFNIPLFLLASRSLGLRSGAKTVATFVLIAVMTDFITKYISKGQPIVTGDSLLSAVYGGATLGLGVFLTFKVGSTSAGTDVLARVLSKGTNTKTSNYIILVDSLVVFFGLLVFKDIKVPLYSLITIFVYGKVLDLLSPENPNKAIFIVSDNPEALRNLIVEELRLRATYLHGRGMYMGQERDIIFMIAERKEVPRLKKKVLAQDPKAFIATMNATNDTIPPLI